MFSLANRNSSVTPECFCRRFAAVELPLSRSFATPHKRLIARGYYAEEANGLLPILLSNLPLRSNRETPFHPS
jgi:hypothetical protein